MDEEKIIIADDTKKDGDINDDKFNNFVKERREHYFLLHWEGEFNNFARFHNYSQNRDIKRDNCS